MSRRWRVCLGVVLVLLACVLLYPHARPKVRNGPSGSHSANNLKQIGLALLNYEDTFEQFPADIVSADGEPLLSWRVRILPFIEEERLYKEFKLDEPWDSPHNKSLLPRMPKPYRLGWGDERTPNHTHYQIFVGPGTAFERPGLSRKDIADPAGQTLLAVEASEPVPWTKPADLEYAPDKPLPALGGFWSKPVHFLGYEVKRKPAFVAIFADSSGRLIPQDISEVTLRALITRSGGEAVDVSRLD